MTTLCHEDGLVTSMLPGNKVKVVVERSEACGSCAAKGACSSLGGSQKKDLILIMDNNLDATNGDIVRLSLPESAVVMASAVLYLIPAVSIIAFSLLGYWIAKFQNWPQDPVSIIGFFIGLLFGLFLSWFLAKIIAKQKTVEPKITAITYKRHSCS